MKIEKYEEFTPINWRAFYRIIEKVNDFLRLGIVRVLITLGVLLSFAHWNGLIGYEFNEALRLSFYIGSGFMIWYALEAFGASSYLSLGLVAFLFFQRSWNWMFLNSMSEDVWLRLMLFFSVIYLIGTNRNNFKIFGAVLGAGLMSVLAFYHPLYASLAVGIVAAELLSKSTYSWNKRRAWNFVYLIPIAVGVYSYFGTNFQANNLADFVVFWPVSQRMEILFGNDLFVYIIPFMGLFSLHFTKKVWKENFLFWALYIGMAYAFFFLNYNNLFIETKMLIYVGFLGCFALFYNRLYQFLQEKYFANHLVVLIMIVLYQMFGNQG